MKQISFAQVLIDAFKILLASTFYKLKLGLTPRLINSNYNSPKTL